MKKNTIKKAAALLASFAIAAGTLPGIAASAKSNDSYAVGYYWYSSVTKKYYDNRDEAVDASGGSANVYDGKNLYFNTKANFSKSYPYYSTYTKKYYPTAFAAEANSVGKMSSVIYGGPDGQAYYDASHRYYSSYTTRYYKTYDEALAHSANYSGYVLYDGKAYNSGIYYYGDYYWYSSYTGKYYSTYQAALNASNGNASYVSGGYWNGGYTYNGSGDYYNSLTNTWYTTLSAALAASSNNAGYVSYTGTTFTVYDYNGKAYASRADAEAAGGTSATISEHRYSVSAPSKTYYVNKPTYVYDSDYYYRNGYYYYNGRYYRNDPYYYYSPYYGGYYYNRNVTADKPADPGVPYLKGYTTRNSWSSLATYVKNRSAGSVVEITMNGATTVPDTFMSALKGRNVTVVFTMDNGVQWTVKGTNVSSAKTVNLDVALSDVDNVPEKLVNKAKENAVAASQIAVGKSEESLGFKGKCTVKFSDKRADCFVKAYSYDSEGNKLKLVTKTVSDSKGYVSFDASASGTYLIVLS